MKLNVEMHDIDFAEFVKVIDRCKGDVFLETDEGDVLNLKSKLCQMMGIANILQGASVSEAHIRCAEPDDETLLFRFNLYRELPEEQE